MTSVSLPTSRASSPSSEEEATQPLEEDLPVQPLSFIPSNTASSSLAFKVTSVTNPPLGPNDTIVATASGTILPKRGFATFPPSILSQASVANNQTRNGKHLLQQQAQRSCAPSAVSMLSKDLGGKCLTEEMRLINLTAVDKIASLIEKAGFQAIEYDLSGDPEPRFELLLKLFDSVPGILVLQNTNIGGHCVVLDQIQENEVTFRDPFHGRMITVAKKDFIPWVGTKFFHFGKKNELQ